MIAVDTNVLVYSHRRESSFHERCLGLIRSLVQGADRWAIPWPCLYEFFSVVTNHRIWKDAATPPDVAVAQIEFWTQSPNLVLLGEDADHLSTLMPLMALPRVRGPIVHDARIAALCIAHGVEALYTKDRDFSLFPDVKVHDPIAR